MWKIRLIQLSDLLLSSDIDTKKILDKIRECRKEYSLKLFDYLLICGNLTADGSDSSFVKAEDFLSKISDELLVKEGPPRRRIVVVPGRRDVQLDSRGKTNYEPFINFYERFFAGHNEDSETPGFDKHEPMFRELKDMTLIGVSHWNVNGSAAGLPFIQAIRQAAKRAARLSVPYRSRTPTLLVTAESLAWEVRVLLKEGELGDAFERRMKGTFHCFGASDGTCLSFEPFVYKHIGVSTGPRQTGNFWPLRFNVIDLAPGSPQMEPQIVGKGPSLSLTVFESTEQNSEWRHSEEITGGLLNPRLEDWHPPLSPPMVICHGTLLEKIAEWIRQEQKGGVARVVGAPGTGLYELHDATKGGFVWQKIDDTWVTFVSARWNHYDNMQTQIKRIIDRVTKWKWSGKQNEYPVPIAILSDEAFGEVRNRNVEFRSKKLDETLKDVKGRRAIFLHIVETFEEVPGSHLLDLDTITIASMGESALKNLVQEYACEMPLDVDRDGSFVSRMSGEYAGIAKILLDKAQKRFLSLPGVHRIQELTGDELLKNTFWSDDLEKESDRISEAIKRCGMGEDVSAFLEYSAISRFEPSSFADDSEAIEIKLSELVKWSSLRGPDSPELCDKLRFTLSLLKKRGILEGDDETGVYYLRVLAPFLRARTPDRFEVFLCYPGEKKREASTLRELIIEHASLRGRAEVTLFSPDFLRSGPIITKIEAALLISNNLVVLYPASKKLWTRGEIRDWIERWQKEIFSTGAMAFAVGRGPRTVVPLKEIPVFDLRHHSLEEISRVIAKNLVSVQRPKVKKERIRA